MIGSTTSEWLQRTFAIYYKVACEIYLFILNRLYAGKPTYICRYIIQGQAHTLGKEIACVWSMRKLNNICLCWVTHGLFIRHAFWSYTTSFQTPHARNPCYFIEDVHIVITPPLNKKTVTSDRYPTSRMPKPRLWTWTSSNSSVIWNS